MKTMLSLFFVTALTGCIPETGDDEHARLFDKKLWLNKDSISYNVRYQMLADLQQNYLSVGKELAEVITLLGVADTVDSAASQTSLIYEVGHDGFDPCYLQIKFDSAQRISVFWVECY